MATSKVVIARVMLHATSSSGSSSSSNHQGTYIAMSIDIDIRHQKNQ